MRVILITIFMFQALVGYSQIQQDSLTIFFYGSGNLGEKLRLFDAKNVKEVAKFRVRGNFIYRYKIPLREGIEAGEPLGLFIRRRPFLWPFHHDVVIFPDYDPDYKYLTLLRNFNKKRRVCVDVEWSNEIPREIHVVDTNFDRNKTY